MTDVRNTGYQAAAQTALNDTELGALANATWSSLSAEQDPTLSGYMFMDIEVSLASLTPTGADAAIEIYVVPTLDGTNYPNFTESGTADEQENAPYFVGSVPLSLDAEAQRQVLEGVRVPTGPFKIGVRNQSNDALASSGNTVKWRPWSYKSA